MPGFHKDFVPVKLGDVFHDRYKTVRKMHWDGS